MFHVLNELTTQEVCTTNRSWPATWSPLASSTQQTMIVKNRFRLSQSVYNFTTADHICGKMVMFHDNKCGLMPSWTGGHINICIYFASSGGSECGHAISDANFL